MMELIVDADRKELDRVWRYIDEWLGTVKYPNTVPDEVCISVELAVEEIFVNIASYAYKGGGQVKIDCLVEGGDEDGKGGKHRKVTITFRDSGVQYNPLSGEHPDLDLAAEDRSIGGLGIYMVKQCMDEVRYEYLAGENILTVEKLW